MSLVGHIDDGNCEKLPSVRSSHISHTCFEQNILKIIRMKMIHASFDPPKLPKMSKQSHNHSANGTDTKNPMKIISK
jgi:hypothetical protein